VTGYYTAILWRLRNTPVVEWLPEGGGGGYSAVRLSEPPHQPWRPLSYNSLIFRRRFLGAVGCVYVQQ